MKKDPFYNLYNIIIDSNKDIKASMFKNLGDSDPTDLAVADFGIEFDINNIEDYAMAIQQQYLIFHDQEPINFEHQKDKWAKSKILFNKGQTNHILGNSEINSIEKDALLSFTGWKDFYWFSNGFLALEWYRYYQYASYLEEQWEPQFLFSCYNRIIKNRPHRTAIAKALLKLDHKKIILSYTGEDDASSSIVINTTNTNRENMAYTILTEDFANSFCHIVTERLFDEDRIHLTEKVFRPIVCCRPFILVSSPGSLQYLKSYGFKTFDKFWDEGYDNIQDHNKRIEAIIKLINTIQDTNALNEMRSILIYNRNHFYNEFKQIITNELWSNLKNASDNKDSNGIWKQIIATLTVEQIETLKMPGEITADDVPFNQLDYLSFDAALQQEYFEKYTKYFRFIYQSTLHLN